MCLPDSLERFRYFLVSVLHPLFLLVAESTFRRDTETSRFFEEESLRPPLCFFKEELGLALSFFLVLGNLFRPCACGASRFCPGTSTPFGFIASGACSVHSGALATWWSSGNPKC